MSKCMPHHFFTSNPLHEYHSLFFNFRLDFLIGLKIKFDVRHRNVQKEMILPVRRLKNALCLFPIDVSFEQTTYKIVLKSETLCTLYTQVCQHLESCFVSVLQSESKSTSTFAVTMLKTLDATDSGSNLCRLLLLDRFSYKTNRP